MMIKFLSFLLFATTIHTTPLLPPSPFALSSGSISKDLTEARPICTQPSAVRVPPILLIDAYFLVTLLADGDGEVIPWGRPPNFVPRRWNEGTAAVNLKSLEQGAVDDISPWEITHALAKIVISCVRISPQGLGGKMIVGKKEKFVVQVIGSPLRHSPLVYISKHKISHQQVRYATLIRRPKRPYTFTQLVTLSDGSTYTHRTTSPAPVYQSTKDTRNTALWNPSSQKLLNVEADEAGRLRAFRERFGRGWDAEKMVTRDEETGEVKEGQEEEEEDNLMDLISGFGKMAEAKGEAKGVRQEKERSGKGKGGER
ncbi:MAG: hypothetical protein Q9225_005577 [Loekoesia sp. 1 TL-2023]